MPKLFLLFFIICCFLGCSERENGSLEKVEQWTTYELTFESSKSYQNPYTDLDFSATFTNDKGTTFTRPGFWNGDNQWKIRFSSPDSFSKWTWKTTASDTENIELNGQKGEVKAIPYMGENKLLQHGLLKMSTGKRNVIHQDGHPFLVVGDTPWSIPFRATTGQVEVYARDRQRKGFNSALLMSLQPDMEAIGPNARNTSEGFVRAFADLSNGHINNLQANYFHTLDSLINILISHEIVPVFQPVFHGFGWKGKKVLGNHIVPSEYVRYCKYLLARYGSQPAFWLLAGDNGGRDPGVKESGEMMEEWDCYQQPTGLHYNPCDDYIADWAVNNPIKHCNHFNKTYQNENWLDFQWAQTGHSNEHLYHKVERMYDNLPIKAVANGEPTYEGMNAGKNGLGWWQGEEAWFQLMSGGTMGVVYGASCLWQWKVTADEPGWQDWTNQDKSWKEAMQMEGANYVGMVAKAVEGFDITDMEKRWELTNNEFPLLAKEDIFYLSFLKKGGTIMIKNVPAGLVIKWFNPKDGTFHEQSTTTGNTVFKSPNDQPWVLIIGKSI